MLSSLSFSLVLVTVLLLCLFTQAFHSVSGACWQGLFRNWILWRSLVFPQVHHEGACLLHCHCTSTQIPQVSQCADHSWQSKVKLPVPAAALLCWKSHFQTWLPTALSPTHYPGFATCSASGNFSPHLQLTFLTENWATVNIWHDQFCSPTKYDWPFSSDPNQCLLLLIALLYTLFISAAIFPGHSLALLRGVCTSPVQNVCKVRSSFFG